MSEAKTNADYDEIDEEEEEALLKSDDEYETVTTNPQATLSVLNPPAPPTDEDSLILNEDLGMQSNSNSKDDVDNADMSDDDDMDDDEKASKEYYNILKELEANQYAYDKYVRLCELAHATADLDNIRYAYSSFAKIYPLSPELWLKYLAIELTVAQSPNEINELELLYRKALSDYYSIDIALELSTLAARCAEPMLIWKELIGTYGLNCFRGQEFFKRYRDFIKSTDLLTKEDQQNAHIESYLQELQYPLKNMEENYIEFKVYCEKNKSNIQQDINWDKIDNDYFSAKDHLRKILTYEEQLEALEPTQYRERAAVYAMYIKETDKYLNENVLQTVYERMVADCCLNADCWLTYIEFVEYRDQVKQPAELQALPMFLQTSIDINNRALRNCTWCDKVYIKKMQLLEAAGRPREEVQEVLETAASAGFQTAAPTVAIWLEYLTYLRRHTEWEEENSCDIIRKNFNLAWTVLGQQWGVLADCNCEILQFWGRLEYGPLRDPQRGKELWTTVMESSDNASKSGLWIEFAQLEMRRDLNSTRNLYRMALQTPTIDNPTVIASAWERFERCNGSVKTLNDCKKICLKTLNNYYANFEHVTQHAKNKTKLSSKTTTTKRKATADTEEAVTPEKKLKQTTANTESNTTLNKPRYSLKETAFKDHENQEIDLAKDHLRIFLSNLDYNLNEDDIRAGLSELKIVNIDLIRAANGRSRGFGYIELESADEVAKALKMDGQSLNSRPLYISSVLRDKEQRQKFKYSDSMEPKKLFVKVLPNDTTKEELEQIFGAFGKLSDVRLVYHKSGKFKNIAYVEYVEEAPARKAVLATNNLELRGHQISVAISAPPPKTTSTPSPSTKILGLSTKRTKAFDQKPRMSLIPNVVRKKFGSHNDMPPPAAINSTKTATTNGTTASKSNEDFRKLLQK